MKRLVYLLVVVLVVAAGRASSFAEDVAPAQEDAAGVQDTQEGPAQDEVSPLQYMLEPKVDTWLGAKVADLRGATRAAEYSWMRSSPTGGFRIFYFPLPQRLDAEFNFIDEKNHDAELSYSYKDILVLDFKSRALWHNLDHFRFAEGSMPGVGTSLDRNPTAEYGVAINDNRLFLRLKWPNNPYHVFVELRDYDKEGDIQQRFLIGSFSGQKTAETRHIDWDTQLLRIGANGHFGPVEAEYQHGIKAFNAGGQKKLFDNYPAVADPLRPAGIYQHNVVPDLERSWDTVELHTSYTGRIVGNLTLTNGQKRNRDNLAYVNYVRASTAWSFIPLENLTLLLRLKHDRVGDHNPQRVVEPDLTTGTIARVDTVSNRSITLTKETAEVAAMYYPFKGVGIKTEYRYNYLDRKRAYDWRDLEFGIQMPSTVNLHSAKLSAWARPVDGVSIRGNAGWDYVTEPLNPVGYRNRVGGQVNGNWAISHALNFNANYKLSREDNPFDFAGQVAGDRRRHVARDNGGANLSWNPAGWFNATAYYSYMRTRVNETLTFQPSTPNVPVNARRTTTNILVDSNDRDTAQVYGITADTAFASPLNFGAEFHQSFSRGRYDLNSNPAIQNPVSGAFYDFDFGDIPGYTDIKIRETGGSFTARYDFPKGWGASATYSINNYEDLEDKPQDGPQDGTAHVVMLLVSKRWY